MTYVPLARRFEPLPDNEAERTVDWTAFVSSSGLGWVDLIQDPLVVILGPGGIGKTTEMMNQAHALRADGKAAVFVRLEDLVQQQFEDALTRDDATAFRDWDPARSEAIFLLDAINEAKLNAPNAFRTALRTFARAVAHGAGKVRVILSCRPSDWKFRADPATIRDALNGLTPTTRPTTAVGGLTAYDPLVHATTSSAAPTPLTTEAVPITTVRLTPLSEGQVRKLAVHHKVVNTDAFIAALSRTGGLFLAGRPRDLEWLAEQWNREQRFGSLWEMLDRNVWAKLQERNPNLGDRDRLPTERAVRAAELLAGATILCRQSHIRIPDPHLAPSGDHPALDPAEVLVDWAPADIAALLRRPLFEEAPGGRVRFHHTTTQAFLAGRWLLHLLEEECSPRAVLDLMLRENYGAWRRIPSMMEVAGWVACKDANVRRELLKVAPEWVLLGGDAEQIPVEDRARALRALAHVYRAETRFPWGADDSDIARIVDPALDPVVQSLLTNSATSGAVRSFLLEIARVGKLPMSAGTALTFAIDATQEPRVRLAAVTAVGAANDTALRSQLYSYALNEAPPDNRFLAQVGQTLFPNTLSVEQLAELLPKFEPGPIDSLSGITYTVAWRWVEQCPTTALDDLLERLVSLATTPPHDPTRRLNNGRIGLSQRYGWLIQAVVRAALKAVQALPGDASTTSPALMTALRLVHTADELGVHLHDLEALRSAVSANAALRRIVLRDQAVHAPSENVMPMYELEHHLLRSEQSDIDWLLVQAVSTEELYIRGRLLDAACQLWAIHGRSAHPKEKLRDAITTAGLQPGVVEAMLEWFRPRPVIATDEYDAKRAERDRAEARIIADSRLKLEQQIAAIRSGEAFGALHYLVGQMSRLPGASSSRWGQTNIHALAANFGPEITEATHEGLQQVWRRWSPLLPSEHDNPTSVEAGVPVGLTGLALLASDGVSFECLSSEEARTAVHYALREMNGLPEWFAALLAAKPEEVKSVLDAEIRGALAGDLHDAA